MVAEATLRGSQYPRQHLAVLAAAAVLSSLAVTDEDA